MTETRSDAYGYNDKNELICSRRGAESAEEYAYLYDDIGNRMTSLDLATNRTYTANVLNQYTQISNLAASCDRFAARPSVSANLTTSSQAHLPMGRAHPQGAVTREEFLPQFDDDGNQTLIKTATGIWQVSYNAENRPVNWSCGTTNIVMKFDRMGRRVEYVETVSGTTNAHHRFVYEITAAQAGRAQRALQAERTERSDEVPREPRYLCVQRLNARSGSAIELSFAWDPTEPVATRPLVLQRQGGWNFFYTHDMRPRRRRRVARRSVATEPRSGRKRPRNKNVSDVVSFQQARGVPAHYEYAPFGAVTAATTNTAFTAFNVAETNPYRFSSEYADDALGLVYYNYRHYDPVMGRWLKRDIIDRDEYNLYAYINNQSVSKIDERGLSISGADCEIAKESIMNGNMSGANSVLGSRVSKLINALRSDARCMAPEIQCGCCSSAGIFSGSVRENSGRITICTNKLPSVDWVASTIVHELTHAYDSCKGTDFGKCEQRACSEVRAVVISGECSPGGVRRRWGAGGFEPEEECIKRIAKTSTQNDFNCILKADEYVDVAFTECSGKIDGKVDPFVLDPFLGAL